MLYPEVETAKITAVRKCCGWMCTTEGPITTLITGVKLNISTPMEQNCLHHGYRI